MERLSTGLMTPDGKYYVYGENRELSNLYVVAGQSNLLPCWTATEGELVEENNQIEGMTR